MSEAIDQPTQEVVGGVQDAGVGGHPRGLTTLFFTEMWERFSYYGMRALLTVYPHPHTAPLDGERAVRAVVSR